MIGIVVALRGELRPFNDDLKIIKQETIYEKDILIGNIFGQDVTIAISNVGKVNSAMATQILIERYQVDNILNFGICGSTDNNIPLGSVVGVKDVIQYDFDLSEIDGVPAGQLNEYKTPYLTCENTLLTGLDIPLYTLGTADKFSNSISRLEELIKVNASLCDMEGGAIVQVCKHCGVPITIIKGISDYVGQSLDGVYDKYYKIASENIRDTVLKMFTKKNM